jgi:hypothetical protein
MVTIMIEKVYDPFINHLTITLREII